jgi:hypothetical protein
MYSTATWVDKVACELQHELEAMAREPLPENWVDLIHRLNAEDDARALKATITAYDT